MRVSNVTIDDLGIDRSRHLSVRVGVKADAAHVGGLDLFGRRFGNYPQDIVLRLRYHRPQEGGGGNGG